MVKNLLNITDSAFKADPFPFYARLRSEQPIAKARFGNMKTWLVTRYDDVLTVLKDQRFSKEEYKAKGNSKTPWIPSFIKPLQTNMLDQDDPNHARLRSLVHKAFTPSRIEQLETRIRAISDQLIDKISRVGQMELIRDFALPLPLTVITELLGIPSKDHAHFKAWSKAIITSPSTINMFKAIPALWSMARYLRSLFAKRKIEPKDDLITALVQAEEAGDRLNTDELLAMVFILLIAGHETTVNLISSGVLALLDNPDQLKLLQNDPKLINSTIEELLRFTSPVETATERYALENVTINNQVIRKGELVLAVIASANRDEKYFEQADKLDITRQNNRHLAFGHGIHYCLGAPLARMEGRIAITTLLNRLPNLKLAVPRETLQWRATPVVRGLKSLPVIF